MHIRNLSLIQAHVTCLFHTVSQLHCILSCTKAGCPSLLVMLEHRFCMYQEPDSGILIMSVSLWNIKWHMPIELFDSPASHLQKVVYWICQRHFFSHWIRGRINMRANLGGRWLHQICSTREWDHNFSVWFCSKWAHHPCRYLYTSVENTELAFSIVNRVLFCTAYFFENGRHRKPR